jgi:hypothetical protein
MAALSACGDLALGPDREPTSMTLSPEDTLLTEGDIAELRLTVLDQDGNPFPGVPSWALPTWSTDRDGALSITPEGQVTALTGGEIKVDAALAGLYARAFVRVNPADLQLSAPSVYLVQSVQDISGRVPMVAGRDALLRVYTTGDQVSFYQPRALARFFQGDVEVYSTWLQPGSYLIPDAVDESRLDRSFNATIPGDVIQPGLQMVVELDPEGVVPLAPGSRVRVPEEGRRALDVREMPLLELTVVPVLLRGSSDESVFLWTSGLNPDSEQLRLARATIPTGELDVTVHETYTSSADLTTNEGWQSFLREIRALHTLEGGRGYYYGAVSLPSGSRWGGLGYIGLPVSVGADSDRTFAHELGHNVSLRHAPCGSVSSFDSGFPYEDGSIGVWGYDPFAADGAGDVVDPAEYKDLMGYCNPRWVSDYHFRKAMEFRLATEAQAGPARAPAREQRTLLLWGGTGQGGLVLEPAFVAEAPVSLPQGAGPYRVEGFDEAGASLFSYDFDLDEVEFGGGHFVFAVPYEAAWEERLARIELTGPEGSASVDRDGGPVVALLTNPATGRVRALVRNWEEEGDGFEPGLRVQLSRGVPTVGQDGGGS